MFAVNTEFGGPGVSSHCMGSGEAEDCVEFLPGRTAAVRFEVRAPIALWFTLNDVMACSIPHTMTSSGSGAS